MVCVMCVGISVKTWMHLDGQLAVHPCKFIHLLNLKTNKQQCESAALSENELVLDVDQNALAIVGYKLKEKCR